MIPSEDSVYTPVTVLEIEHEAGLRWKKAGVTFCENNGWDWEGNAYLLVIEYDSEQIDSLAQQLNDRNINLYDYARQQPGFVTARFGFDEPGFEDQFTEMDTPALEICEAVLADLQIKWCGWAEAASFTLVATEAQLEELISRLEEPIKEWQEMGRKFTG